MNIFSRYIEPSLVTILGISILWSLGVGAVPAVAKQPLFDAYRPIVVLDPGHGGSETGARGADGTAEKTVALELARMIAAELQRDYKVKLTRTDDYHVDLDSRAALANQLKADVFVSLHTGGSFVYSTAGAIVYHYQNVSRSASTWGEIPVFQDEKNMPITWDRLQDSYQEKSKVLARMIHSRLSRMESIKDSRVQGAPLAVLQGAHMPSILIEAGYLTHPAEEKNLRDRRFLMNLAAEISKGIKEFLSQTVQ